MHHQLHNIILFLFQVLIPIYCVIVNLPHQRQFVSLTAVHEEELRAGDSVAGVRLGAVVDDGAVGARACDGGEAGLYEAALRRPRNKTFNHLNQGFWDLGVRSDG